MAGFVIDIYIGFVVRWLSLVWRKTASGKWPTVAGTIVRCHFEKSRLRRRLCGAQLQIQSGLRALSRRDEKAVYVCQLRRGLCAPSSSGQELRIHVDPKTQAGPSLLLPDQSLLRFQHPLQRFLSRCADRRQMPHLAAHLRGVCFSYRCRRTPGTASAAAKFGRRWSSQTSPSRFTMAAGRDERRIAERQIAGRSHQLLKLAGDAAALALVVAVVRTRRELIHQQLALPA